MSTHAPRTRAPSRGTLLSMDAPHRSSPLALAVLSLLGVGPLHPYGMQRLIKLWGKDQVINVGQRGNLYKTIKRLHQEGLIAVHQMERDQRFPERTAISDLLAFNRSYRQHIDNRQAVEVVHWWELREAVQEADRLYHLWDTARDARCDYYYVTVRRQALKRLREMLGDESYAAGQLPPHVPLWRFQKID